MNVIEKNQHENLKLLPVTGYQWINYVWENLI